MGTWFRSEYYGQGQTRILMAYPPKKVLMLVTIIWKGDMVFVILI